MAMEGFVEEFGAKAETIVFLDHFRKLPDPRQRGKGRDLSQIACAFGNNSIM